MNKTRKMVVVLLMVFGAVSVSFGVDLLYNSEKNYQKLKAEMAEYGNAEECKWSEDGKKLVNERSESLNDLRLCKFQKVIAFFDEIKATELKDNELKNKITGRTYRPFDVAVEKVREMPRFKNDSSIYSFAKGAYFKEEAFWKSVWREWDKTKLNLEIRGIKGEYWKAVAKESK